MQMLTLSNHSFDSKTIFLNGARGAPYDIAIIHRICFKANIIFHC